MNHSILIIDDEKIGADNLKRYLDKNVPNANIYAMSDEVGIKSAISSSYYNVAIVDLRMDDFSFDGIELIQEIIELNPFARIIIISAYTEEFEEDLNILLQSGKVAAIIPKSEFNEFAEKILKQTSKIISDFEEKLNSNQIALADIYSDAKNEENSYKKGVKFENFVSLLFSHIGFRYINKRIIDKSRNEVDLVVRNDLDDLFFAKFSPYFFIECKNTKETVDKNTFIVFKEKIQNSNNLANFGFIVTSNGFKRTTYLEALRTSGGKDKVIFISNSEIEKLISSSNALNSLKEIIDLQVKDN